MIQNISMTSAVFVGLLGKEKNNLQMTFCCLWTSF